MDLGWRAQRTILLLPVAGDVFSLDSPLYRTRLSYISNNVGPVKLFLNALLSFHLKELFSFAFFGFLSSCIDDHGSFVI